MIIILFTAKLFIMMFRYFMNTENAITVIELLLVNQMSAACAFLNGLHQTLDGIPHPALKSDDNQRFVEHQPLLQCSVALMHLIQHSYNFPSFF